MRSPRFTVALILAVLGLFAVEPAAFTQSAGNPRWVGTWSTSEVGRPQTPPPPLPALPPFQPNQCPPGPPAAPTFSHFNNQTLRQIVHASIGGSSLRVVLSNA